MKVLRNHIARIGSAHSDKKSEVVRFLNFSSRKKALCISETDNTGLYFCRIFLSRCEAEYTDAAACEMRENVYFGLQNGTKRHCSSLKSRAARLALLCAWADGSVFELSDVYMTVVKNRDTPQLLCGLLGICLY